MTGPARTGALSPSEADVGPPVVAGRSSDWTERSGTVLDGLAQRSLEHWEAVVAETRTPDTSPWTRHGWQLARVLLDRAQQRGRSDQRRTATRQLTTGLLQSPTDLRAVLHRRSLTGATPEAIDAVSARVLTSVLLRALTVHTWLVAGVVHQAVQGVRSGSYLWQTDPVWLDARRDGVDDELLLRTSQGQGFVRGGGCVFFLGVDWHELKHHVDDKSLTDEARYCDALVDIGAVGHALVVAAHALGLGTRMTPALHESSAAELFCLPPTSEMLYLLKVGVPFPT